MTRSVGIERAIAEAVGVPERQTLAPAAQLDLLAVEQPDLPAHDRVRQARAAEAVALRGRGRPPGSRNRRTQDFVAYFLSTQRDPLLFLASVYQRTPEELAAEVGCSKADALALQVRAASEVAPYVHGKQPVRLQVQSAGAITLLVPGLNAPAQGEGETLADLAKRLQLVDGGLDGAGAVIEGEPIDHGQIEQNQGVSQ
jgi:hypothetical protein